MAKLILLSSEKSTVEYGLDKECISIGRGIDNDIQFKNGIVSRHHAQITGAMGEVLVEDVNTPPAKAGGFWLRLQAGLIGHAADYTTVKSSSGSGGL